MGVLSHVPPSIIDEMNQELCAEFHEWEVEVALKDIPPLKTPGPSWMPLLFYQHFWNTIDSNVI